METISLTIDGLPVQAHKGQMVLEAAQEAGIFIPTLCADPDLRPYGACRLCLVEIERTRGLPAACTTPVAEGMVVWTDTPQVARIRRNLIELLLAEGHDDCLVCAKNNHCELQRLAAIVGVRERTFSLRPPSKAVDDSNPFFYRELDKCILCGKCVRVCDEIQGRNAIFYAYRGFEAKISAVLDRPVAMSTCESCGQCVQFCPVGALRTKNSVRFGTPTGETRTICPYCGVGCGLILETRDNQVIGARGDEDNPVSQGRTCVKGRFGWDYLQHPDRLTTPLIRKGGQMVPASWDEALDLVADRFVEIAREHGPDALAFLSSAKCTNEENYLTQKMARGLFGTNNVDHCARL